MKKLLIGVGVLCALVLAVAVAVPLLYPIDSLRPRIQEQANKAVRGKVELGKLSLSVFPTLGVVVDGVTLSSPASFASGPFAKVAQLKISIPFYTLLTGPQATVVVKDPSFEMVSQGNASNLSEFLPAPASPSAAAAPPPSAGKGEAPKAVGEVVAGLPSWLAGIISRARLSVNIENAHLKLRDLKAKKGDKTEIPQLNVTLKDIGVASPMKLYVKALLDVASAGTQITGESVTEGTLTFQPKGSENHVALDVQQDLSGVDVRSGALFHKPAKTPLTAAVKGLVVQGPSAMTANLEKLEFRFGSLTANVKLQALIPQDKDKGTLELDMKIPKTELAPFGAFVPMVAQYKLGGGIAVELKVTGSMLDPTVYMTADLFDGKGATPQLNKPIEGLRARIQVSGTQKNPKVSMDPIALKVGESDFNATVQVQGLEPMNAKVTFNSKLLDADALLGLLAAPGAQGPAAKGSGGSTGGSAAAAAPAAALDETLHAMAPTVDEALKNPMLDQVAANVAMQVGTLKFMNTQYRNANLKLSYAGRKLNITGGLQGYGGEVKLSKDLTLKPGEAFAYAVNGDLAGLKLDEAAKAHAPKWGDMIAGAMVGKLSLSGAGLRKEHTAKNLKGSLTGEIKNGRTSLPVIKMVADALQQILPKLPGNGFKLPEKEASKRFNGEFKTAQIKSSIVGRNINLEQMDILYDTGTLGLGDLRFVANGTVNFDRQAQVTGVAYLNPNVVRIGELTGPSGQIEIPVKCSGEMSQCQPDWGYTLGILVPRVAERALKAKAQTAAQQAAQNAAQKALQNAPPAVQQGAKELLKKFKF